MYEKETENDKQSQVDWFWAICMIWSGVVDIETLRDCFLMLCLYKKFSKIPILLAFGVRNYDVVCNRNQSVVF